MFCNIIIIDFFKGICYMRRFIKVTKGAVSVFLAVIIIPIVTLTSIFVDSGKVVLARGMAEAAGDLALNTLLTNYDKELNEYFGLIASAQSMDEAISVAEEFFVTSMISAATESEDKTGIPYQSGKLGEKILGGTTYSDLLGLTADNITIKPLENGSLANPAMLKRQTVEFMKYRGPINAISEFCSWLFSNDIKEQTNEMDEVSDMTDKKNTFYEKESDLMSLLLQLRNTLIVYDGVNDGKPLDEKFFNDLVALTKNGGELDQFYKNVFNKILYDYFNIIGSDGSVRGISTYEQLKDNSSGTAPTTKVIYTVGGSTSTEAEGTESEGQQTKTDNAFPDIEKALDNCATGICKYYEKEASFLNLLKEMKVISSSNDDIYNSRKNEIYDVQYWACVEENFDNNASVINDFTTAAAQALVYMDALQKCWNQYQSRPEEAKHSYADKYHKNTDLERERFDLSTYTYSINGTAKSLGSKLEYGQAVQHLKNHTETGIKNSDGWKLYNTITTRIGGISENSVHKAEISGSEVLPTVNKSVKYEKLNTKIKDYKTKVNKDYETLTGAYSAIQSALDLIPQIEEKLKEYNTSFKAWDTSANNLKSGGSRNNMVETDVNEIAQKKSNNGGTVDQNNVLLNKINKEDLNQLSVRLSNIKTLILNAINAIDNCTFCGKKVKDIETVSNAIEAADSVGAKSNSFYINDIKQNESKYNYKGVDENAVKVSDGNNPDLNKNEPKLRKEIYDYFRTQEINADKNNEYSDESAKSKKDELKSDSEKDGAFETGASDGCATEEIVNEEELPSSDESISQDLEANKSGKLSELVKVVQTLLSTPLDTVEAARDDLLVSDYIMSMFSYDTYQKEMLLGVAVDNDDAPKDEAEWSSKKSSYEKTYNQMKDVTYWKYNKNLRNIPIDSRTCFSFGNEVEYILYGGTNSANKTAAYCRIFALRFVCDMVPVFKSYWSYAPIEALASSISAATLGVIPVPLIKLLVCLGLTIAESVLDLTHIREGFGVKFFKKGGRPESDCDLFCSFDGITGSDSSDGSIGFGISKGYFQYSHYLRFFLIMKLITQSSENDVLCRMADVIQVNMRKNTSESFKLVNSNSYFMIDADIGVKPLMLAIPINASEANPFSDGKKLTDFKYSMTRGY